MNSDLRNMVRLAECAAFQEGYVNPSQRDLSHFGEDVKWLRATDLNNGYVFETGRRLSKKGFESAGKSATLFAPGTLAISKSGTIGRIGILQDYMCGNRAVINIKPNASCDSKFVFYTLLYRRPEIETLAEGSVQKNLYVSALSNLKIKLPPLAEQKAIGSLLGVFDDRIALLRETNATLESIAHALFKSWFVSFDPVREKSEGRVPEGMDEATAALFPASFEESTMGLIPSGWRAGLLGDFAMLRKGTVNPGSKPDTVFEHFSLPAFDDGQRPVRELGALIKSNKTPVCTDAVLLSKLNPHIPRVWLPVECGINAVCSTEFLVFQPTGVGNRELIYCAFTSPEFTARLQQLVTGTSNSHQRIKPDQVALMSSVVPEAQVTKKFEAAIRPVFERVHANKQHAQTLAALRDTLLPRLISGQLRLSEGEALLEDACA